ncbi:MAG: DUF2309 domain-containing protein [Bryobacteraceae bacterium]
MSDHSSIEHILAHLAHLLPAQGPIGVFVHHNTLHAFQHLPFEQAVCQAAKLYGAEPYMRQEAFRRAMDSGRIRAEDIDAVLAAEPQSDLLPGVLTRRDLRRAMLRPGARDFRPETIAWEIGEAGLTSAFRTDLPPKSRAALAKESPRALFDLCLRHTPVPEPAEAKAARPRDGVLAATGIDTDDAVHPLLIRLAGAFLDQGLAYWPMPERENGFWKASLDVLGQPFSLEPHELDRLPEVLAAVRGLDASAAIPAMLETLGVPEAEWEHVLEAELLALPGWAGMMHRLEVEPELAPHEDVPASLMDFVAVRLLLTGGAVATQMGDTVSWRAIPIRSHAPEAIRLARAARYFDAAQLCGLSASTLSASKPAQLRVLFDAIDEFDDWERRRLLHLAYERRHERQILLPILEHARREPLPVPKRLAAQVFFCIDEREESTRRHLEEIDPEIETYGAAGFFGVAMNYHGLDDAHAVALCPVVVKPQHEIKERPMEGHHAHYERRRALRKYWSNLTHHWWVASRTLVRGWIGTTVLGLFTIFPLAARVLSPRRYARFIAWLNSSVLPEPRTELAFMRTDAAGHAAAEGLLLGFSIPEKVDRVASVLGPAGLRKGMARLVVVLGHGSTSLNNPHESAHDCGACGGRRGGPNGRIFAAMANHPEVRKGLRARDIVIPDDTWFVGGYHDTCNDDIDLYDLDEVPATHRPDLARVRASLDKARARDGHERARRFEAADYGLSDEGGLHHVQERSEHLAEPRPEYGHCTNAVCIVGRRSSTRGLFLDRRSFLVSYDAAQDPTNDALARVLGAVIPVCGGISLEYYFSFVDNEGYGCGTKLPHNVTGLIGVMNGAESDLRTGLPWQMVEIHEPVRILFVLETTPDRALSTIHANPQLWEFLNNRWIRLAVSDPQTGAMHAYRGGEPGNARWEAIEGGDEPLFDAPTSRDWYAGRREHLPIARIGAAPAMAKQ